MRRFPDALAAAFAATLALAAWPGHARAQSSRFT